MVRRSLVSLFLLILGAACSSAGEGVDDAGFEGDETAGAGGAAGSSGASGQAGNSGAAGKASAGASGASGASGSSGGSGGASAGQGGSAGQAASGSGGASGGAAGKGGAAGGCADQGPEPNDSEALASPACAGNPCEIGDKDADGTAAYGGSLPSIAGVVGAGDADYFVFHGKDNLGNVVDPAAKTDQSGFTLCIFTICDKDETQSFSCSAGTPTKSPSGLPGCCVQAPGEVHSDHDCKGSLLDDDAANVIIRIDQATSCSPYLVDFHF